MHVFLYGIRNKITLSMNYTFNEKIGPFFIKLAIDGKDHVTLYVQEKEFLLFRLFPAILSFKFILLDNNQH